MPKKKEVKKEATKVVAKPKKEVKKIEKVSAIETVKDGAGRTVIGYVSEDGKSVTTVQGVTFAM